MSIEQFDDECKGCKPAIIDAKTGKVEPDDSPVMKVVMRVWAATTLAERKAFHNVCCLNSREQGDMKVMAELSARISAAAAEVN